MKAKATFFLSVVLTIFLLASCAPKISYTKSVGFVDYSVYQNKGIFLTESNSVNFEYDAIGSVTAVIYSGDAVLTQKKNVDKNDIYGEQTTVQNKMGWKTANPEDALEAAVSEVISKGGDGLINIKITPTTEVGTSKTARSGFLVTGMAIKRK